MFVLSLMTVPKNLAIVCVMARYRKYLICWLLDLTKEITAAFLSVSTEKKKQMCFHWMSL